MSLFTRRVVEKKSTLEYFVDTEDVTEEDFIRFKEWIAENIPSTERYTPKWKPDDDIGAMFNAMPSAPGNGSNGVQLPAPNPFGTTVMAKLKFRFKYEEHAMAFKLIL